MRTETVILAAMLLGLTLIQAQDAQRPIPNRRQGQNPKRQTQKPQPSDRFAVARQHYESAQGELRSAESSFRAATNGLAQARLDASRRHGNQLGFTAAATERSSLQRELSDKRAEALRSLAASEEYKTAIREAGTASTRLRQLGEDPSLTDDQRRQLGSELAAVIRRPIELQQATLANSEEVQDAHRRLQMADQKLIEMQGQLNQAAESDEAVARARDTVQTAGNRLGTAQRAEEQARGVYAEAQVASQRATQASRQTNRPNRSRPPRQPNPNPPRPPGPQ